MRRLVSIFAAVTLLLSLSGCYTTYQVPEENMLTLSTSSTEAPTPQEELPPTTTMPEQTTTDERNTEAPTPAYTISPDQVWVDFNYIKDYKGITDTSLCADELNDAITILKASEDYSILSNNYRSSLEDISAYIDDNGDLTPKFHSAYIEDFDNNGNTECFILLDLPQWQHESWEPCAYLFYSDGDTTEMIDTSFLGMDEDLGISEISLLDYGLCKQLIICNSNTYGFASHSAIYGVVNGKSITHYHFRGSFSKWECFISAFGWQGSGGLLCYDTSQQKYLVVNGEELDPEEVFALDKTGILPKVDYPSVTLFGGKYYIVRNGYSFFDLGEIFTYENGEFIPAPEDCRVRINGDGYCEYEIIIDDIDSVLAQMITTEQATKREISIVENGHITLTEVSPDQLWIDYSYTDAIGTTDTVKCGDSIDAAITAFMQTEDYIKANNALLNEKVIGELDSLSSEHYYNFDGENYLPVFECAFIDDFDYDGQNKQYEQFILLKFPYNSYDNVLWRRHYLIFVDSNGNAEMIDSFYQYYAKLLDYGYDKQLIIGGAGYCGNDAHTALWGVINDTAKELYSIKGSYEKHGCFLTASGAQGLGDFMYYDTSAKEYHTIIGDYLNKDEVYAMDISNSAPYDYDTCFEVSLVGGKYYLFSAGQMDYGKVCIYENGRFIPADNIGIRTANGLRTAVKISDIDLILSEML